MPFTVSAFADEISDSFNMQMKTVKKYGFCHIEMRGADGKNVSDYTPDEMKTVKLRLDRENIKISAIGSPMGKISVTDAFDGHLEKFKNTVKLAKILETDYIRIFSFYIPSGEKPSKYRDEVLKRIDAFVRAAKSEGIILLHENEKGIYGDNAERCFDILSSIGSDSLFATFDPANFVQCGETAYPHAFELLKPFIKYMHIKDALPTGEVVPSGQGAGCVKEILSALKDKTMFTSIEPHLGSFSGLAALEQNGDYSALPTAGEKTFKLAFDAYKKIISQI